MSAIKKLYAWCLDHPCQSAPRTKPPTPCPWHLWRVHDIRRTVTTNMAMMGLQPHIIEAVLNHKSGIVSGVASIYSRYG